jgi:hypothetical protein
MFHCIALLGGLQDATHERQLLRWHLLQQHLHSSSANGLCLLSRHACPKPQAIKENQASSMGIGLP